MKTYVEVMKEFVSKKFGKLSSELLINNYMKKIGITSLKVLNHEQQVKFSNFFIEQVLKKHMPEDKVKLIKKQLSLKYCLDNALEAVNKQRFLGLSSYLDSVQLISPNLILDKINKNDFLFKFNYIKDIYFFIEQNYGIEFMNILSNTKKETFEDSLFEGFKNFLQDLLKNFSEVQKKLEGINPNFKIFDYKNTSDYITEISNISGSGLYVVDMVVNTEDKEFPLKLIIIK